MRRVRRFAAALAFLALACGCALADPLVLAVKSAEVAFAHGTNQPVLRLTLTPESAKAFGELTAANVGRVVELRLDGKLMMAPVVREPIVGGAIEISGDFVPAELKDVADRIAKGDAKVEVAVRPDQ